ncbi:MAG: restriction endonuclease [Chloroflexi bacterium]|nr:restriction endonuclease [Chloroflexota bacterium]
MTNITVKRAGELLRSVFEILWDKPDGLPAREILLHIPHVTKLTDEELKYSPGTNIPRYEKIIRIATIPIVQVGWLEKDGKGHWRITQDGYNSCSGFASVHDFYQEALRLYNERRQEISENVITIEVAQEAAWAQIKRHLFNLSQHEIQIMLAELLRAMEYHPSWMAPPEKQRGKINLIVHTNPMGIKGERILVQIIHKGQAVTLEGIKSFASILGVDDFGMVVSTGGFTNEATQELGLHDFQRITALDATAFFNLWETYYYKLSEDAHRFLPLKAVNFLAANE